MNIQLNVSSINLGTEIYCSYDLQSSFLSSLQIPKLNDIVVMHIVSFVYKCVHNLVPAYFNNYFTRIHDVTYLLCDVTQPNMGSILFIILVFVTGILYHLKSEILTPFPIFGRI